MTLNLPPQIQSVSREIDPEKQSIASSNSHKEPHFGNAEIVRDIIIGLSDGLTVPFALAAGLSSLQNSRLVVTAGVAEIIAGSISMGLGGYLAGISEIDHYDNERRREEMEVRTVPERELNEIVEIFEPYGLDKADLQPLLGALENDHEKWVDFMMKFELNLEKPSFTRSYVSAITIGFSYLIGGVVPLLPYIFINNSHHALFVSVGVTCFALFIFGMFKAKAMGSRNVWRSAIQTLFIGACAAGAAYGFAILIPQN